jgi:hypothetical protein
MNYTTIDNSRYSSVYKQTIFVPFSLLYGLFRQKNVTLTSNCVTSLAPNQARIVFSTANGDRQTLLHLFLATFSESRPEESPPWRNRSVFHRRVNLFGCQVPDFLLPLSGSVHCPGQVRVVVPRSCQFSALRPAYQPARLIIRLNCLSFSGGATFALAFSRLLPEGFYQTITFRRWSMACVGRVAVWPNGWAEVEEPTP